MPAFAVQILYPAQRRCRAATRSLIEYMAARVPQRIAALLRGDSRQARGDLPH